MRGALVNGLGHALANSVRNRGREKDAEGGPIELLDVKP
jgi:hypothetical protein